MFAYYNGYFQFKIELFKMIGHALNIAGALYAMVVGKIENGILIKLRDHRRFTVAAGCFYVLTKSIPIAAAGREGNRSQNANAVIRKALAFGDLSFFDHQFAPQGHRISVFPIAEEHAHSMG